MARLDPGLSAERDAPSPAELPDRMALYLASLVRRAISSLDERQRTRIGGELIAQIVALLGAHSKAVDDDDALSGTGEVLRAVLAHLPTGAPACIQAPATPLLDTTLLTNAPGEPHIGFQLKSEIDSADGIDVLMAFVRQSGIRPLLEPLRRHVQGGHRLRLLTTTYTGSTELSALIALERAGADIRVSYDTRSTRLHAKAWLFHRSSGFSTGYIGSSNLTHSAQVTGLEWNVRVAAARNPDLLEKFSAVFESYWESGDFRRFDEAEFRELTQPRDAGPQVYLSPVEIRPEPFQSRMLELIALARLQGRHRNLLVSATGTGKTVMAALDYQRLCKSLPRARLLFVAHRREILDQSLATFRHALRDAAFGELWVDGAQPTRFEHVFASIQSLSATGLANLAPDHFDVVIIDEFHHAAAKTYDALLKHLKPRELLGLTATPERGDGEPILHWFDGRIAAELRLWDAIDQQRLCPFSWYGIADGVDLSQLPWVRGRGYEPAALSNLVTGDTVLARRILANIQRIVPNPGSMRALGFCVSVAHARFMADQFMAAGVAAGAVWGDTSSEARQAALAALADGRLRVLFSVDLFNEGVDLPAVDTLLLLRPTDSPTLFLQQLGRGLRREEGKRVCTVLDFVGRHRKEFRFDRRFAALLGGTRKQLERHIEHGFPYLPSGCQMELDPVASQLVLENIRQSVPRTWRAKAAELRHVAETMGQVSLQRFLDQSGLELEDLYSNTRCWSDLLEEGRLPILPPGPREAILRRAIGRLLHVDDPERIETWRTWLASSKPPALATLGLRQRRVFHMLAAVLCESLGMREASLQDAADVLWQHPQVLAELAELLAVIANRIEHLPGELPNFPDVPLCVHARYSRSEILAAFADGDVFGLLEWREGARWLPDAQVDMFVITLDKSSGNFSPTTRYRDYAISETLLHWESQSTTRADSPTGQRYQQHATRGSAVLPFVRLSPADRAFWLLGPATYVRHEGERPMAVTWRLDHAIPGDLYSRFAAVA
ncbi:MAG TPA: DUF3427 domain-containing protein [Chiayiivirga sp.]|nr:DUF3427 domain-containing protein [Chiayiivirga sp.]